MSNLILKLNENTDQMMFKIISSDVVNTCNFMIEEGVFIC